MLESIFSGLYSSGSITLGGFFAAIGTALILGAILALVYMYRTRHTASFVVTLALLPATASVVIMMVSGNLGAGVAVAGTFSLIRFRSVPGTAREIGAIFLAMAVGLACGMGYPAFAALFTLLMCAVQLLYLRTGFGRRRGGELVRTLQITVPENLEFDAMFDDLFAQYTSSARLLRVKTANLGSLNRLTYEIILRHPNSEKKLIDALRCRNGNLEISCSLHSTEPAEL